MGFFNKINRAKTAIIKKLCTGFADFKKRKGNLKIKSGGYIVFDMGKESVGGYPFFSVANFKGKVKVRLAYSDRRCTFANKTAMMRGDFDRGTCGYLGVELPVMPGNPYRYEDYSITRAGEYAYPLIQGQERFCLVSVYGEDNGEVEFSDFYIFDNSDEATPTGKVESDNKILDKLFIASARTVRLATIKAEQWEFIQDRLFLRKLTADKEYALLTKLKKHIKAELNFSISLNPENDSGIGFIFYQKKDLGYKVDVNLNGLTIKKVNGKKQTVIERKSVELIDNVNYFAEVILSDGNIGLKINDEEKFCVKVDGKPYAFGISMEKEWRATLFDITVQTEDGLEISDLEKACACSTKTDYFISDGAKRDRLPWTGDLDWAFEGGWYAFGKELKAMSTLLITEFNSTPEGFIWGTCYPENKVKPKSCDYGYYQADTFAVWHVVSALKYYLLSGDKRVKRLYPAMKKCMEYIWGYVDKEDGLFFQRRETSKGLWDNDLGEEGKDTYTNLLISFAYLELSKFALEIGKKEDASIYSYRGQLIKDATDKFMFSEELKGYVKKKDSNEICDMSNPFALANKMVDKKQASLITENIESKMRAYGKVVILAIKGLYEYGYKEKAYELFMGKTPMYTKEGWLFSYVDWASAIDNPDYPETTYECMHNPPCNFGDNNNWGDMSHPDSTVSGIINGYIVGVRPLDAGFKKILVAPSMTGMKRAKAKIPLKRGFAKIYIEETEDRYLIKLKVPKGIEVEKDFTNLDKTVDFELIF